MELSRCFPGAKILGIDLSPYFLAVATALQEQRQKVRYVETTSRIQIFSDMFFVHQVQRLQEAWHCNGLM